MIFDTVDIHNCEGCYLAHSLRTSTGRIGKGTLITTDIAAHIAQSGVSIILVAQLEQGDTHEDEAARIVASQLGGKGVSLSRPRTGRVNLLADVEGLCHFSAQAIIAANAIDEGITIATLPENQWVAKGRMVATIKIIPYAVPTLKLQEVLDVLSEHTLSVETAIPHKVELIQTRLNSIKEAVLDKTSRVTKHRLTPKAGSLERESRCQHNTEELKNTISECLQRNPDWILIVGASAISDRADIIPKAIVAAGGTIDRYGIPVDPGNLLLLAHIGSTLVVGLPGCARSPRYNGLDMILNKMACEIPITDTWLSSLAVGGLLAEIADRPAPRINATEQQQIGALILAAGSSRRAGEINKLLTPYGDKTMVSHIAQVVSSSQVCRVVAVTGHEQSLVMEALSPLPVECHHNTAHNSGMASSVVTGVSQLTETDGILVFLGDMPHITTDIINTMIDAFKQHPDKSIFLPVNEERRGNPVLFGKVFFDNLLTLEGDIGAKKLVQQYPDEVFEVMIEDDGVLVDYDTAEELAKLPAR